MRYSLRQTIRDRLRAAEIPLEAIDQLGGWFNISTIGSRYEQEYTIKHLNDCIKLIVLSYIMILMIGIIYKFDSMHLMMKHNRKT